MKNFLPLSTCILIILTLPSAISAQPTLARDAHAVTSEQEPSILVIPVSAPLDKFIDRQALEAQVPIREPKRIDIASGEYVDYYWERDPFSYTMTGNMVMLVTDLRYRANYWRHFAWPVNWKELASCGEGDEWPRRLHIQLNSALSISNTWQLTSTTTPAVAAQNACTLHVLVFSKDVTNNIKDRVLNVMLDNSRKIDTDLPVKTDLRSKIEKYWRQLSTPISLGGDTEGWLSVNPVQAGVSAIQAANGVVTASVVLIAHPAVSFGTRPETTVPSLPDNVAVTPAGGFHISLPIYIGFDQMAATVKQKLADTTFSVTENKSFHVTDIVISGTVSSTVLTLTIAGDISGELTLRGSLKFQRQTGVLSVTDLSADLRTNNALLNLAVAQSLPNFIEHIQSAANWPIQPLLDVRKGQLSQAINRRIGDLSLSGAIDDLRLLDIHTTTHGFVITMLADGRLSCLVE